LLVVACQKREDPGPPCDRVVDHMLELTKQALVGHEAMTKDLKRQMVQQCEQRHYSKEAKECLLAATDPAGLAACNRAALGSAAPPPPSTGPRSPQPTLPADGGIPAP
jgi:hypothetical protein